MEETGKYLIPKYLIGLVLGAFLILVLLIDYLVVYKDMIPSGILRPIALGFLGVFNIFLLYITWLALFNDVYQVWKKLK